MTLKMLGVRVPPGLKLIIKKAAKEEHRSVSNFVIHAVLTYLKETHKVDYRGEGKRKKVKE